ncbi:hypothetical protein D0869_09711 [Hortaea werneckii]|uniref:PCI domain-containing protein n=1 Tax=Hortaea werneckii TaxID=91943 RepID=A0A3M6YQT7_HORWE|nr:hypothetical protein KC324_g12460 [Hortaea werneckii]KAI7573664.1 hypothetical protein KC316_g11737 [Hortaea werneckii]RMX77659.1 hypothetical protein D0869_09711 [Hortaea werneckii]RMY05434.1 hypothetical protein D0868_06407 [Hortaea werneckii]
MAQTPLLGQFLVAINGFIQHRNEGSLAEWIALEPPFNEHYLGMIKELHQTYAKGNEEALESRCSQVLKAAVEGDDGAPWTAFIKFMVQYLSYLRDVSADVSRLLETYELLSELQQRGNSALGHSTLGHLILPVVIANAKLVCRLAIGLDKQPELIANIRSSQQGGGDEGARETLPERAANTLRQAFVTCLNDRVSSVQDGRPQGKKKGIYLIANLCLKILFQCRKTRNATQIFENIYNLSPPLSIYPKSQRVTYLYYLGRYLWQNNHFYRAQLALQYAYDESPARPECKRQRRHILVYLLASNIILGRFPSSTLFNRPEAQGLAGLFLPLCRSIRAGDLAAFHHHLSFDNPHAPWFLHFRILLQLRNRAEVLVWRSLVLRTYALVGVPPQATSRGSMSPAFLDITALCSAFEFASNHNNRTGLQQAAQNLNDPNSEEPTDPDFVGIEYDYTPSYYNALAIESKLAALIDQHLLNGYIAHRQGKLCITGASKMGGNVRAAGFPKPWGVFVGKVERSGEGEVPGWKREREVQGFGGAGVGGGPVRPGPGMVVNLSGARMAGAAG